MMFRTQIYLPAGQLKLLKRAALAEEVSLSEMIRKLIEEKLMTKEEGKQAGKNAGSWLLSLAQEAKRSRVKGPKDLAANLDEYLYGRK